MFTYQNGNNCSFDHLYEAFTTGFSDYMIKLSVDKDGFKERFFGPEGNCLEFSHVAFDGEKPVGVLLGGVREWQGVKTLRCGALAISPDYRGQGISEELMKRHVDDGIAAGCKRLFLEVIKGNDRAIRFYEKMNYEILGGLRYYHILTENLVILASEKVSLERAHYEDILRHRETLNEVHLHWQGEPIYYKDVANTHYFSVQIEGEKGGLVAVSSTGKLVYLWIDPRFRQRGYGSETLTQVAQMLELEKLHMAVASDPNMECYAIKLGFIRDNLQQYEMFKVLA